MFHDSVCMCVFCVCVLLEGNHNMTMFCNTQGNKTTNTHCVGGKDDQKPEWPDTGL